MPNGLQAGLLGPLLSQVLLATAGFCVCPSTSVADLVELSYSASVKSSSYTPRRCTTVPQHLCPEKKTLKKHKPKWVRLETIQNNSNNAEG